MMRGWRWLIALGVVAWALADHLVPAGGGLGVAWDVVIGAIGAFASMAFRQGGGSRLWSGVRGAVLPVVVFHALFVALRAAGDGASPRGFPWLLPWIGLGLLLASDLATWRRLARLVPVEALKARRSLLSRAAIVGSALLTLAAAFTQTRFDETTGWSLLAGSLGSGFFAAEVFILVLGATAISGEATGGTLKMMLPHAYRRADWVVGKAVVLVGVAVVLALVVSATGIAHAAATEGLGDVVRVDEADPLFPDEVVERELFATASTMHGYATARILTGAATLAATAMLGLVLSVLFDSVVASLCGAFLVFAGLKFADLLFRVPEELMQSIYGWYPDRIGELLDKLGRALSEGWNEALLPTGLSLALVWGALFLLVAVAAFDRSDVHA